MIAPYSIQFLENITEDTQVKSILAKGKILQRLHERAKEEEELYLELRRNKGKILMALEEKVLQHKKRLARQQWHEMICG